MKRPRAFKTTLEWFVNLSRDRRELGIKDIEQFTRQYGLLRWNWTHEAWGGSRQHKRFYLPVEAFRKSYGDFREQWAKASSKDSKEVGRVGEWLRIQLAAAPQETDSLAVKAADRWKLSQPSTALEIPDGDALEVRLVFGDLWQALCAELLDRLIQNRASIRICENERCNNGQPIHFIARDPRKKYCGHPCAKQVTDRKSARKRRARLRRARKQAA